MSIKMSLFVLLILIEYSRNETYTFLNTLEYYKFFLGRTINSQLCTNDVSFTGKAHNFKHCDIKELGNVYL